LTRRPNPWIVIPALVAGAIAAWLGGTITAVSCRYRDVDGTIVTCPGWTATVGVLSFLVVAVGVAVVMVLVYRSLAEWQEQRDRRPSRPADDQ
jgi:membrane protein implicated in regulation of membrane protease activity